MSAAELELLLRKILGEGVQIHPVSYLALVITSVIAGAIGAFLGAYLKRRGENLATKADFDSLMGQLREQTREVEAIKSEIAQAGWVHQRRWDLKRELYWQLLEMLEELKQKGRWLFRAVGDFWGPNADAQQTIESFAKHIQERGTVEKLLASKGVAGMILSESAVTALEDLSREYNLAVDRILSSGTPEDQTWFVRQQLPSLLDATDRVYAMVLSASQEDLLDTPHIPARP
jgi:hypothetical protein